MHAHSAVLLSHASRHAKLCSLPPLSLQHMCPSSIKFYVSLPNVHKLCAGQELAVTRLLSSPEAVVTTRLGRNTGVSVQGRRAASSGR